MRSIRAIWFTTEKLYEELPGKNPCIGVQFNRESRRQEPVPWEKLPNWRKRVAAIDNPVRRAYQFTVLFTGLRRTDAATIRWMEIDFAAGTVHRPFPKGGTSRAFTIPMAAILLRLLSRHRHYVQANFGKDCEWVFPTRNRAGKIVPLQEPKENGLPSPHRLRDTFTTAAYEAGVDEIAIEILTNHRPAKGSVTRGYIGASIEHLRLGVEKTTRFLLGKMAKSEKRVTKAK